MSLGTLYLRTQLEVRSFVHADNVPKASSVARLFAHFVLSLHEAVGFLV